MRECGRACVRACVCAYVMIFGASKPITHSTIANTGLSSESQEHHYLSTHQAITFTTVLTTSKLNRWPNNVV